MQAKKDIMYFVKDVSRLEDSEQPYQPEYLEMKSEYRESERICDRCDKNCQREGYSEEVYEYLEDKQKILSGGNRIIDAIMRHGIFVLPEYIIDEGKRIDAANGEVELEWDSNESQKVCEMCRLYGRDECPEDVYGEKCARKETVQAVEKVVKAVNYLLS